MIKKFMKEEHNTGKDFRMAYLIIAYTDPKQLSRLVKRLSRSADVYVHINAKVDIAPFRRKISTIQTEKRVCLIKKRYPVAWGGYSIVKATFALLEEALGYCKYDRVILLTGLDYPVKSDEELVRFFVKHQRTEFLYASKDEERVEYYSFRDCMAVNSFLKVLQGVEKRLGIKKNSDHVVYKKKKYPIYWAIVPKWALTGEAAEFLLNFYRKNKRFNSKFWFMFAPDDFYVATVLLNSKYKKRIETKKCLFKIIWIPDHGAKTLTEEDYDVLMDSEELYAKNFHSNESAKLWKRLEEHS